MRVFVTGATGFIGSAVVQELLRAGHQVLGLARTDSGAARISALGVEVHRGNLDDLESLRAGAAASDGVIHTAYDHTFTDMAAAVSTDQRAIEALGQGLAGSHHPLVMTSGSGVPTEDTIPEPGGFFAEGRYRNEQAAMAFIERGVRAVAVRFPFTVHGRGDHGFVARLIQIAREKGVSAYPGDGTNHWPAVHRLDGAHLFRLAVESAPAGSRLHGVAEGGIPVREIAEVIGRHLDLPVRSIPRDEATEHFGFLGAIFAMDAQVSSALTRQRMGWEPVQPGLIADLEEGHYFDAAPVGPVPSVHTGT